MIIIINPDGSTITTETGPVGPVGPQGPAGAGTGDMLAATYDSNTDGVIAVAQLDPTLLVDGDIVDEDNMASDSDVKIPTQQSVKAYVDALLPVVTDFVDLGDVPASYVGLAGQYLKVNATADGLDTGTPSGAGDMLKSQYDPNNDGVIAVAQLDATLVVTSDARLTNARTPVSHDNTYHSATYITQAAVNATKIDDLTAGDDNTDLNASSSKHGLVVKAVAPSAGLTNVLAIENGETVWKNKALYDATAPSTQAFGDAAAVGTAVTAARRDHKHAMPAVEDTPTNGHTTQAASSNALYDHAALTTTAHGGLLASSAFSGVTKITVGAVEPSNPNTNDVWIDTSA